VPVVVPLLKLFDTPIDCARQNDPLKFTHVRLLS